MRIFGNRIENLRVTFLASGCYNQNYLAEIDGKRYVFRISTNQDKFEGGKLESEYEALVWLNGLYAPRPIYYDGEFPCLIEEFFEGKKLQRLDNFAIKGIAKALAAIHLSRKEKGEADLGKEYPLKEKSESINKEYLDKLQKSVQKGMEFINDNSSRFSGTSYNVLNHGDLHCDNILIGDGLVFIDWENSCFNDPVFDIVAFLYESENGQYFAVEQSITGEQKQLFLDEYMRHNNDKHLKEKIKIAYPLRWVSDTLWLAERLSNYQKTPKENRSRSYNEYLNLFYFNLRKLEQLSWE